MCVLYVSVIACSWWEDCMPTGKPDRFYRKDTEPLSCVSNISQFKKCDVLARITLTWLFYFW